MRLFAVLLCAALVPACVKSSDLFCESDVDCADTPETPVCDVAGQFAASDFTKNTCIASPYDAGPIGEGDAGGTEPDAAAYQGRVKQIVAGRDHVCVLLRDGTIRCWGEASFGALGYGNTEDLGDDEPVPESAVAVGGIVERIGPGFRHTCAVLDNGATRCWGSNSNEQLGFVGEPVGDDEAPETADPIAIGGTPGAISGGVNFTCALLGGGNVRCWGANEGTAAGVLGYGVLESVGDDETPAQQGDVPTGGTVMGLATGAATTCAIHGNGTLRCWGRNTNGSLGYATDLPIGDDEPASETGTLSLDGTARSVAASESSNFQCVVLTDGRAKCWGASTQLGHAVSSAPPGDTPDLALGGSVREMAVGGLHTCALLEDGRVRCWGSNTSGQLGLGNTTAFPGDSIPDGEVDLGGPAIALAAGDDFTCALINQGDDVRCWGANNAGQLGQGNTEPVGDDEVPAEVPVVQLPEVP